MANPSPTLSRKVELAAIALMGTIDFSGIFNADGVTPFNNFSCGKASLTKQGPLAIAYAEEGTFDQSFSGNGHVKLHIIAKYPMGVDTDGVDPVVQSDLLTSALWNAFRIGFPSSNTALADALNALVPAIPDFTAMSNQVLNEEASAEEGLVWVETLTLDIYAGQVSGM